MAKKITSCFGIVGIVVIAMYAISKGMDGATLAASIVAIAGLGGYDIYAERKPK